MAAKRINEVKPNTADVTYYEATTKYAGAVHIIIHHHREGAREYHVVACATDHTQGRMPRKTDGPATCKKCIKRFKLDS